MKRDNRTKSYQDPKSLQGILARGKTQYPGGSPNPKGKNQFNPRLAAIQRLRKNRGHA